MLEKCFRKAERMKIFPSLVIQEELQKALLLVLFDQVRLENAVLQGGTAIHLFLDSPRYSLDLDFIAESPVRREAIAKAGEILGHYCAPEGISLELRKWSVKGSLTRAEFRFQIPGLERKLRLRLDFLRGSLPSHETRLLLVDWLPGKPAVFVPVRTATGLLADKVVALGGREIALARDVFDAWFLLDKGVSLLWEELEGEMERYGITLSPFKRKLKRVRALTEDPEHLRSLNSLLPPSSRISAEVFEEMVERVLKEVERVLP